MIEIETEVLIGKVEHFYSNLYVIMLTLSCDLGVGDKIRIIGGIGTDFTQIVTSMEHNHRRIEYAKAGDRIGIKVKSVAREGYEVRLFKEQ